MIDVSVNGKRHRVDVDPDTPLLWVIREAIGLTGTKFGCGMALCGACTVHLDGAAVAVVRDAGVRGARQAGDDDRRAGAGPATPSGAGGVDRGGRAAVRLLPVRPGHERRGAPRPAAGPDGCGHRRRHERQHLPVRHLPADPRGDQACRGADAEGRPDDDDAPVLAARPPRVPESLRRPVERHPARLPAARRAPMPSPRPRPAARRPSSRRTPSSASARPTSSRSS